MPQTITKRLAKELGKHERKWVALSRDHTRIVDIDASLARLDERVKSAEVVFMKVPPADGYLSFPF